MSLKPERQDISLSEKGCNDLRRKERSPLWQKYLVAVMAVIMLYGPQIRMFMDSRNRFLDLWERQDGISIIFGILVIAAIVTALYGLAVRLRFQVLASNIFLIALGGGAISTFMRHPSLGIQIAYLGLAVLVTASLLRPLWNIPRKAVRIALIFSPVAAILIFQLLTFSEWKTPRETFKQAFVSRSASPIFIFIFDEWSYTRSTDGEGFLPSFKNLNTLAKEGIFFENAISPWPYTDVSLPRIVFQSTDTFRVGAKEAYWERDGRRTPTTEYPSLFSLAKKNQYSSAILSFYLPWRKILGDQVDYASYLHIFPKRDSFLVRVVENAIRNLESWFDPFSQRLQGLLNESLAPYSRQERREHWREILGHVKGESLDLIKEGIPNNLIITHLPVPHAPYVFEEDGTPITTLNRGEDHEIAYMRHLGFVDTLVGEFIGAIKSSGRFEEAMIIVTSDHSWREDFPAWDGGKATHRIRHVPLVIKLPYQHHAVKIKETFELTALMPAIEAVMAGRIEAAYSALEQTAIRKSSTPGHN